MAERKASYHHGDLRNALVEAATELVRKTGADDFSLRDAAKAVGVSANAMYRHFESKAALLTAVANEASDDFARRMQRKLASIERAHVGRDSATAAVASVRAYGRAYVDYALDEPALFHLQHSEHGLCTLAGDLTAQRKTEISQQFGRLLDRLVDVGLLTRKRRLEGEIPLWMALHGFSSLALDGLFPKPADRKAELERLLDFALRGLGIEAR